MVDNLTEWSWKQDIKPEVKLTLLSLIHKAKENKSCVTYSQISDKTGLSIGQVISAIENLINHGLIILVLEEPIDYSKFPDSLQKQITEQTKRNFLPRTYAFICE